MRSASSGAESADRQCVAVLDLEGLGTRHMYRSLMNCFKQLNTCDAANYPELIGDIYVINVGWFFRTLWAAIRPLIDTTTATKVHVLSAGTGYEELVRALGAENLPVELGGSRENAVPYHWLHTNDGQLVFS